LKEAIVSMGDTHVFNKLSLTPSMIQNFLENNVSSDDSYPLIQSKIIDNEWKIIAVTDKVVHYIFDKIESLKNMASGNPAMQNIHNLTVIDKADCYLAEEPFAYQLLTPWIPFGKHSSRYYSDLEDFDDKRQFLKTVLEKHLLDVAYIFGQNSDEALTLELELTEIRIEIDGHYILAFSGTFWVNMKIPDYLGIGRSIRKGYGTIKSI